MKQIKMDSWEYQIKSLEEKSKVVWSRGTIPAMSTIRRWRRTLKWWSDLIKEDIKLLLLSRERLVKGRVKWVFFWDSTIHGYEAFLSFFKKINRYVISSVEYSSETRGLMAYQLFNGNLMTKWAGSLV